MAPIVVSTDIIRPAADVFTYATDPTRFGEWQQGVADGRLDTPGPVRVGARCLTTRRIGGADRASTSEVTHVDPPRTWGVRGIDGTIRAVVDLTVQPLSATTSRLTIASTSTATASARSLSHSSCDARPGERCPGTSRP